MSDLLGTILFAPDYLISYGGAWEKGLGITLLTIEIAIGCAVAIPIGIGYGLYKLGSKIKGKKK